MSDPDAFAGLFDFERELYPDLKCIPMLVRYKLDLVGLKVSLTAWNRLTLGVRKQLLTDWPADTAAERAALREWLANWLRTTSTQPPRELVVVYPPWEVRTHVPDAVSEAGSACAPPLTVAEWADLDLLERVALVKLARSAHERDRVPKAIAEFRAKRTPSSEPSTTASRVSHAPHRLQTAPSRDPRHASGS